MTTTTHTKPDKFLTPKELPDALDAIGCTGWNLRACRMLVRAMLADGAPIMRKKYARPTDAAAWLIAHPKWRPFSPTSLTAKP